MQRQKVIFYFGKPKKKLFIVLSQVICEALTFLLNNIFIQFGTKLYRQIDK